MKDKLLGILAMAALMIGACASPAPQSSNAPSAPEAARPAVSKTLRLAVSTEPTGGIALFAGVGTSSYNYAHTFHAGLTVYDERGTLQPKIANKIPSIDDGDWKVAPDGAMEVTWNLRPDVAWHDGAPLTADDFVFGITIQQDQDIPAKPSTAVSLIAEAVAPDAHTLVLRYRQPYADANASGPIDLIAIPRHLLGDAYAAGNKQAFANSTYWTFGFVGLGPYRLADWISGSQIEAVAFDQYFLGRPKVDRLIIRYLGDVNAIVAGLLSGDIDVVPTGSFKVDEAEALKQRWDASREGTVLPVITGLRYGTYQDRDATLPWARDLRVRQAIIQMTDRQTIVDTLLFGLTTPADVAVQPADSAFATLASRGYAKYPYDLTQANRLLEDAGWRRGGDGVYQNASGEPLSITAASPARAAINIQEIVTIAAEWKNAGLAATPDNFSNTAANTNELKATVHGVFFGNNNIIPATYFGSFTSAQISSGDRWNGSNKGGYNNPAYDKLVEQYSTTLDPVQRKATLVDLAKMGADEAIWIPMYYDFEIAAFRQGVKGVGQVPAQQTANTWNLQTWDVD